MRQTVIALAHRVEELSREVEALRVRPEGVRPDSLPVGAPLADEEPPGGRATVPPVTPAKLSSQAFDVLLGTVSTDRATSRSA
ncbi:MAG: hypothetical protein ACJ735_09055 [Actinomycetes bacterium]